MGRFRLSGHGKDPVKTCCGRVKNVVNTAWCGLLQHGTCKRIVIIAKA
jgi:hypothetical protein